MKSRRRIAFPKAQDLGGFSGAITAGFFDHRNRVPWSFCVAGIISPMSHLGQSRRFRDDRVMSGSPPAPDIPATVRHVGFGPIVLQNSVLANEQNFIDALVRSYENYVGGHMIGAISDRQPS